MGACSGADKEREFSELFDAHYPSIFSFFRRRGCSPEESHDLAQETFVRAFQGLDGFKGEASCRTWLQRIAHNLWLNRRRSGATRKRRGVVVSLEGGATLSGDGDAEPVALQLPSREPDPEGQLLHEEEVALLRASLEKLPPQMQRCVVLRLRDGLKYREIGEKLGVSVQTVRSQLFQGRQRLRQLLRNGGRT